jgi:hypothetical protein
MAHACRNIAGQSAPSHVDRIAGRCPGSGLGPAPGPRGSSPIRFAEDPVLRSIMSKANRNTALLPCRRANADRWVSKSVTPSGSHTTAPPSMVTVMHEATHGPLCRNGVILPALPFRIAEPGAKQRRNPHDKSSAAPCCYGIVCSDRRVVCERRVGDADHRCSRHQECCPNRRRDRAMARQRRWMAGPFSGASIPSRLNATVSPSII